MRRFLERVRRYLRRHEEWREEVDTHLAMRAELNESSGMAANSARAQARRQFGNPVRTLEDVRAVHVRPWIETVLQDVRYAGRGLRKQPLFTLVAVLTLAIGIGASTAVFSAVDRLLFRSLPYAHADHLVSFGFTGPIDQNEFMLGKGYVQWQKLLSPFRSVTSISSSYDAELADHAVLRVRCVPVEANLLSTLGVSPVIGQDFTAADDRPHAPPVVLISYGLWKSRFGGNASVVQHTVSIDDQPTRIAGILPKDFEMPGLEPADILIPQKLDRTEQLRSPTGRFLRAFARLKDGISPQQARQQLQPLFQSVSADVPPQLRKEIRLVVRPLREREFYDVRLASQMLFGAVLALLLIACANVANLLLARAASRTSELAVRAALGAGRARLVRQGLTESLVLAVSGAALGCVFARVLFHLLGTLPPEGILRMTEAGLDGRVLLFTLLVSVVAALLFGIAPALETPRLEALAEWRIAGPQRSLLRHLLLASQIAISIVLLTGASLFVRSLWKLEKQPMGLEPSRTVAVSFELGHHRYNTPERLSAFYNQMETKLRAIPAVSAFALSDSVPPGGPTHERPFSNMSIVGEPPLASEGGMVKFRYVTPDYFRVLGIRIVIGRVFNQRDRIPSQNSIVLSAKLARRMFGSANPLGHRIVLDPDLPPFSVVGVAADVKNNGPANAAMPEYYRARKRYRDSSLGNRAVALFRTALPGSAIEPWIRAQIAALDPRLPVTIETMKERVDAENRRPRFLTVLIGLFAIFGLALAAIGLYGVVAFLVAQRTREIGIRMAIGATPRDVVALVLKHAAAWCAAGTLFGLLLSLAISRILRGLLFEISPHDPLSTTIAVAVLAVTVLVASWWPSYRAAKIDPSSALRYE